LVKTKFRKSTAPAAARGNFPHVGDVKKPGGGAHGQMFLDDARVAQRHFPAAKLDQMRAQLLVRREQIQGVLFNMPLMVPICFGNFYRHPIHNIEIHRTERGLLCEVAEIIRIDVWSLEGSPPITKVVTRFCNKLRVCPDNGIRGGIAKKKIKIARRGTSTRSFLADNQTVICVE
jgi:hypothetical protein